MAISVLQREAFAVSTSFNQQVNGIVSQESLYKYGLWQANLDEAQRLQFARVIQQPGTFGFAATIVSANTWEVSFDTWAADPPAQNGAIQAAIESVFVLLTGLKEPQAQP